MLQYIQEKYRQRKGLLLLFVLTYLDRAISFVVPLSVLLILKNKSLYAEIEVILSYATIISVVVDLGFSNYLFYGYREAPDKDEFIRKTRIFFAGSTFVYFILTCIVSMFLGLTGNDQFLLVTFVAIRTLFVFFLSFYSNIYRLIDTPWKAYIANTILNISAFLLVMGSHLFNLGNELPLFFLPCAVLIVGVSIKFLVRLQQFVVREYWEYLSRALLFSWPIILNVLAMSFINNYAKIYAYGNLTEQEMIRISYTLRLCLIIFLSHTAFTSYFSKFIYMDTNRRFNNSIFRQYTIVLFLSVLMVAIATGISNSLFSDEVYVPFDLTTSLFLLYTILWCYMGYLELYFGVMNANRKVLAYSLTSSALYILLLRFYGRVDLDHLAAFMAITGSLNLSLAVVGLYRLGVFSKVTEKSS